jgi:hypothetical protein
VSHNVGGAPRLDVSPAPGGDSATFNVALTPDAASFGPMQVLLAVASPGPIPALENFRSGPLKSIAPSILTEARNGGASVEADFFKFVN